MDERVLRLVARADSASSYPNDSRILIEALRLATKKPFEVEVLIKRAIERVGPMNDDAHHAEGDLLQADIEKLRRMYRAEPDLELLSELTANDSLGG